MKKAVVIAFVFMLSAIHVNAQVKFTEGVIIFKVDSILSHKRPIDSSSVSVSEIRLYKKNNLRRMDIISPSTPDSMSSFTITQILNEKGMYLVIDSPLLNSLRKSASFETIEELEQRPAHFAISGKITHCTYRETFKKVIVLGTQAETVYRVEKDPDRTWKLLVAKNIDTSFSLFLPEYQKLTGTPLEFYFDDNNIELLHLKAQSITEKPIDDALFTIGPEFDILPAETKISPSKTN
ncbi:hypothetical protein [Dyadobacter sp. CY356]|uniref:hypothetical protein n=1 Tax=Dyadobacter sp. CY356 TaxID=2906442 RepID=UPI001F3E4CF7|nr:hypothetical protein [Dyadobacter sp. CY356]MCF0058177.1 hypothetical protein [Dyadobacter sp. CY356]